ncbi:MAG: hypothetical protein IKF19_06485 [Bacilli bacterium]|nr:hypothetical protein [Bacilli bacterium]
MFGYRYVETKNSGPKIIINDKSILINMGLWLGLLTKNDLIELTGDRYINIIGKFSFDPNSVKISKSLKRNILSRFSIILAECGISDDEICIFDDYDFEYRSFKCHLTKANKDIYIDGIMPDWDSIIIDDRKNKYYYRRLDNFIDPKYNLFLYSYFVRDNDVSVRRHIGQKNNKSRNNKKALNDLHYEISNEDYMILIDAYEKTPTIESELEGYEVSDAIKREQEILNFLKNISFPINIVEFSEIFKQKVLLDDSNYFLITMNVYSRNDYGYNLIDKIIIKYGDIVSLKTVRNGKIITLNTDNSSTIDIINDEEAKTKKNG